MAPVKLKSYVRRPIILFGCVKNKFYVVIVMAMMVIDFIKKYVIA